MIAILRGTLVVLTLHLFETTLLFRLGPPSLLPDLLIMLTAVTASRLTTVRGIAAGMAIGLLRSFAGGGGGGDAATGALAFGVAAWFAGAASRRLAGETAGGLFLILAGTVLVHDLVYLAGHLRYGLFPFVSRIALVTVPAGIITAIVGVTLSEILRRRRRARGEVVPS